MSNSQEVGAWPDRFVLGVSNPCGPHLRATKDGQVPFEPKVTTSVSLRQALETEYDTEALLTCYRMLDTDGTSIVPEHPLWHKTALTKLREEGAELQQTCIGLDWDTGSGAEHVDLTEALLNTFLESFDEAIEADPLLKPWYAMYSTKRGTRVFYLLDEPVPVDEGEKIAAAMRQRFKKVGLEFDTACSDWSRRYLLPQVLRKGKRTNQAELYFLEITDDKLEVNSIPKVLPSELFKPRTYTSSSMYPDSQQSRDRLMVPGLGGGDKQSDFLKRAKQLIRPTVYYTTLFTNDAHFPDDNRHQFLLKIVGFLTPILMRKAGAKPEDIFALLYEPVCQWDPQTCDEDPHAHAWTIVQNIYAKELDNYNSEMEVKSEEAAEGRELIDQMVDGMREWCTCERLHSSNLDEAREFVLEHLFVNTEKYFYPLKEDGWYSRSCLQSQQLVSTIRRNYLDNLIETVREDSRGNEVDVTSQYVINKHVSVVYGVAMSPLQCGDGRVTNMDDYKAKMVLPMYRLNPSLTPQYNEHVEQWLHALFGKHYDDAARWIGYALEFEAGPICALSIKGDPSIGKKLLVTGLSECLEIPKTASGQDVCGDFNGTIVSTPFVNVNEGWPSKISNSPADMFRIMTSGDDIPVREMYKPRVSVINPMRVILTANDHGLLYGVTKGKDLSPESKKAIGERLMHFDLDDSGAKYLNSMGGRGFTEKEDARWIRGDTDQPSNYVVARHFMWLHANRPERDMTQRYCVMGNCAGPESELFQIAEQSANLPLVRSALINMAESNTQPSYMIIEKDDMWVTRTGILRQIREIDGGKITEPDLEACWMTVMEVSTPRIERDMEFFMVDMAALARYATKWGKKADKVHRMVGDS